MPDVEPLLTGSLLMIRHGQTDWNKKGLMQGSTDIELNEVGREQALYTAQKLAQEGIRCDVIVSSPLSRAFETAQIVGNYLGVEVSRTYEGLVERHYGEAEGQDISLEARREPDAFYQGVESERSVYVRGIKTLRQIVSDYPGQHIIAVSHGSLIRRVLSASRGEEWKEAVPNAQALEIPLAGLFRWAEENEPLLVGKP
ncbi:histidine phosphatase family protein [Rothia sp. P7181]|uniref:histidine phosphatase family protein n=1 Tax=unclassified Rothia (in: high G+C Gram-positive bacteria) TaxID=2689056 RepID=UPI003ABFFE9E